MKVAVSKGSITSAIRKHRPGLRLSRDIHTMIHLNCLMFFRRLAIEARDKAVESKCSLIQPNHVMQVAKTVLKKSRG
ncbi:centromere protein W [Callorhinchus milii]|uniref:Centromere protein W-like isoform 1 n=1 Tax=Callorhinchus milii TaxID=7868 RepID=K4FTR8_CALMI|nr:centromere protein W [Callorhinchus milii]AFK11593.1 centromere protein W-like isoform 1 [Callorhinchus milii]|eukprot:gi/632962678/ref/XP_007897455.1/ PREDICTED: centromere protein W [Callorhinchus milii]